MSSSRRLAAILRAEHPWGTDPRYVTLTEPTLCLGLRRAGFPDE
jgi:hypothetical protein